ncbi:hypothetical protein RIF29_01962 [Crotalaria pallida]|uniref:Ssl1-like domain-containing protein n=1 Tax=Crotalaria pallida TaxID=3830 RepID=A0AAN9IY26_CROPI
MEVCLLILAFGLEDGDEDEADDGLEAWERTYAKDRSWESLQEDESGLLRPIDNTTIQHVQYRKRLRALASSAANARIQKGLIQYLYIVVDLSKVEAFIREFFDQNSLSHVGLVTIKDGIAHCLTELGGSPESHIKALMGKLEWSGDASLQNSLELVLGFLNQIPSYGHREVLVLYPALSTCDPAIAEYATANLIKMSFPQRAAEGSVAICTCHEESKIGGGYTCTRCKVRVCELPTECRICGLTLISSPHLARSYHHLFPIVPFDEVSPPSQNDPRNSFSNTCFGCQQSLLTQGKLL